jgi:hypothetical protein
MKRANYPSFWYDSLYASGQEWIEAVVVAQGYRQRNHPNFFWTMACFLHGMGHGHLRISNVIYLVGLVYCGRSLILPVPHRISCLEVEYQIKNSILKTPILPVRVVPIPTVVGRH